MRITPPCAVAAAGRYRGPAGVLLHGHPLAELLRITAGACRVEVPARAFACDCGAGDVLVLPARCDHWHQGGGTVATAWLLVRDLGAGLDDAPRRLPLAADDPLRRWLDEAEALHHAGAADQAAHLLAAALARIAVGDREHVERRLHPAVERAQHFIEAHRDQPLALRRLAAVAGVSAPHLAALFRRQLGATPLAWQTGLRLAAAERLLADPARTVQEVAAALGFADANWFCRLFRRHRGASPDAWRRSLARRQVPHRGGP
jgi:AraC-like DNA-binding protein